MPDRTLITLLDEVRGKTLLLLQGLGEAEARWAPPGLQNSILWHAGHAYLLLESLPNRALGRDQQIPVGWYGLFSWDSRPGRAAPDAWPPLKEVADHLRRQYGRMRTLLENLSENELGRPASGGGRSVRYYFVHALHDEACHSGEIWLLRKLQRRPSHG